MKKLILVLSALLFANLTFAMREQGDHAQQEQINTFDEGVAGGAAAAALGGGGGRDRHCDEELHTAQRNVKILSATTAAGWALAIAITAGWLIEHYVQDCDGNIQTRYVFVGNGTNSSSFDLPGLWAFCKSLFLNHTNGTM